MEKRIPHAILSTTLNALFTPGLFLQFRRLIAINRCDFHVFIFLFFKYSISDWDKDKKSMKTIISISGDDVAVQIPKIYADHMNLADSATIEIELTEDGMKLTPAKREASLESLIEGITPSNLHDETDWGEPVGEEIYSDCYNVMR